jgi:hypothetical protein
VKIRAKQIDDVHGSESQLRTAVVNDSPSGKKRDERENAVF